MSKNKNYRNYSNYGNNKPYNKPVENTAPVVEEPVEVSTEETIDVMEVSEPDVQLEVVEPEVQEESLVGTVFGCEKLNVRVAPESTATPVTVIDKDTVVVIDSELSTEEWYKVYTEAGVEGYCMKKFVKVNA